jgi:phosphoribosylformylglycinamidine cyclo-ligase
LAEQGSVEPLEMFNTFNMGIGFVVLVPLSSANAVCQWFLAQGVEAWAIGEVVPGSGELILD